MRLWNKIRARFGRDVDGGLAEEMRLHRAMLEDRFRAEGLSPDEARNRAAREFGPDGDIARGQPRRVELCVARVARDRRALRGPRPGPQ